MNVLGSLGNSCKINKIVMHLIISLGIQAIKGNFPVRSDVT